MKIVKYRIWDKYTKKMYYPERLFCQKDGTVWHVDVGGHKSFVLNQKTNHLMQFIGLHDEDGNEIYEGDLVEHDDNIDGLWETYNASEIVFDEYYSMYCLKDDAPNLLSDYRNLKIVGNVYQNSETL